MGKLHVSAALLLIIFSTLFIFVSPVSATDLDIPIVVRWDHGVPYDLDGPVEVYKDSVWVKDKSGVENRFILIDRQYQILEERKVLERPGRSSGEGEPGVWFASPEHGKIGTLAVSAILPEELLGKDVVVTVSDSSGGNGSLYLRQANGYEQSELVPAGRYQVFEAKVLGDVTQRYDPVYEGEDVVVDENGYGHIEIEFREGVAPMRTRENSVDEDKDGREQQTDKEGMFPFVMAMILVCITGMAVAFAAMFLYVSVRMNRE